MPYRPTEINSRRLVAGVWGDIKTGKTHFCLTAPAPIYFINTDYGFREILSQPEFKDLDIWAEDIPIFNPGSMQSCQDALAMFHETFVNFLNDARSGGTIVIDNASFLWDLVAEVKRWEAREARFKKQKKVDNLEDLSESRFDWGLANLYMNTTLRRVYHSEYDKVNMILTHAAAPVYERGEDTGKLKLKGFNGTGGIVQVLGQTYRDGEGFKMLVQESRHAPEQKGMWFPDPTFEGLQDFILGSE